MNGTKLDKIQCENTKSIKFRLNKQQNKWTPLERRKRGRPRKMWIEGVQEVMATRNLEPGQWRNRVDWSLVCGRRRQLL